MTGLSSTLYAVCSKQAVFEQRSRNDPNSVEENSIMVVHFVRLLKRQDARVRLVTHPTEYGGHWSWHKTSTKFRAWHYCRSYIKSGRTADVVPKSRVRCIFRRDYISRPLNPVVSLSRISLRYDSYVQLTKLTMEGGVRFGEVDDARITGLCISSNYSARQTAKSQASR